MTENGDSIQDRYSHDRTPWMAHPVSEPPDSAGQDIAAVALAIAVLLVIGFLATWLP